MSFFFLTRRVFSSFLTRSFFFLSDKMSFFFSLTRSFFLSFWQNQFFSFWQDQFFSFWRDQSFFLTRWVFLSDNKVFLSKDNYVLLTTIIQCHFYLLKGNWLFLLYTQLFLVLLNGSGFITDRTVGFLLTGQWFYYWQDSGFITDRTVANSRKHDVGNGYQEAKQ